MAHMEKGSVPVCSVVIQTITPDMSMNSRTMKLRTYGIVVLFLLASLSTEAVEQFGDELALSREF